MRTTRIQPGGFTADRVSVSNGARTVVSDLTLHLQPGTWTQLVGASRADTSLVLAALSGRRTRTAGALLLDGEPLPDVPPPDLVGYVSRSHHLVATLTAAETLIATLLVTGRHPAAKSREATSSPGPTRRGLAQPRRTAVGRTATARRARPGSRLPSPPARS